MSKELITEKETKEAVMERVEQQIHMSGYATAKLYFSGFAVEFKAIRNEERTVYAIITGIEQT
jgi:hypothetical protein